MVGEENKGLGRTTLPNPNPIILRRTEQQTMDEITMLIDGEVVIYKQEKAYDLTEIIENLQNRQMMLGMSAPYGTVAVRYVKDEGTEQLDYIIIREPVELPIRYSAISGLKNIGDTHPPLGFIASYRPKERTVINFEVLMIDPGRRQFNPMPGDTFDFQQLPTTNISSSGTPCTNVGKSVGEAITNWYTSNFNSDYHEYISDRCGNECMNILNPTGKRSSEIIMKALFTLAKAGKSIPSTTTYKITIPEEPLIQTHDQWNEICRRL